MIRAGIRVPAGLKALYGIQRCPHLHFTFLPSHRDQSINEA